MSKEIKTLDQLKDSRLLYEKKLPAFGYILILTITALLIITVIWSLKTPKIYMIKSSGIIQSTNKNYVMSPFTGQILDINITLIPTNDTNQQITYTSDNITVAQINAIGRITTYLSKYLHTTLKEIV